MTKTDLNLTFSERSEQLPPTPFHRTRNKRPTETHLPTTPKKPPVDISWERAKQRTSS